MHFWRVWWMGEYSFSGLGSGIFVSGGEPDLEGINYPQNRQIAQIYLQTPNLTSQPSILVYEKHTMDWAKHTTIHFTN